MTSGESTHIERDSEHPLDAFVRRKVLLVVLDVLEHLLDKLAVVQRCAPHRTSDLRGSREHTPMLSERSRGNGATRTWNFPPHSPHLSPSTPLGGPAGTWYE